MRGRGEEVTKINWAQPGFTHSGMAAQMAFDPN